MGLFDRFKRVVKSNINEMISKAEDPQKVLNQAIVDMNEQLIENKKVVASSIADEKKMERQMRDYKAQSVEWERKARLALQAGKEPLAKEALLRKQEFDNLVAQYQPQWEAQHENVEKLKTSLRQVQQKIEEAQRKKNLLVARAKRAEAQKKIQSTISTMSDTSAFEAFERMENKVNEIEAEAEAYQEIDDSVQHDDLESQFAQLEGSDSNADLLLEQLKQKMIEED